MSSDNTAPLAGTIDPAPAAVDAAPERRCQNCGTPLLGEHCYACGQPTKGLVRHFSSIIGDFMDTAFNLDTRMLRTVFPLLFRPGYLTGEYFAGRRVRYVSPVRLFVFLSIVTFFAAQLSVSIAPDGAGGDPIIEVDAGPRDSDTNRLRSAETVEEVERIRDAAVAELRKAKAEAAGVPGVGVGMDIAEKGVIAEAERRIAAIRLAEESGEPAPIEDEDDDARISFNGTPWDAKTNPVQLDWLPAAANASINDTVGRAQKNLGRIKEDPDLLKDAFFRTVPTTLFVLLPLFALLLKIAYVFKRRLYMEHLIVALHSHSFLCAGLLLAMLTDALKTWTAPGVMSGVFGAIEVAVLVWLPVYLLLMQKRVYGQGWIMTLLKYGVLGTCYFLLLSFGAMVSLMVSLVSM